MNINKNSGEQKKKPLKPHDAKWQSSRRVFLSYPHTHDRLLYSSVSSSPVDNGLRYQDISCLIAIVFVAITSVMTTSAANFFFCLE